MVDFVLNLKDPRCADLSILSISHETVRIDQEDSYDETRVNGTPIDTLKLTAMLKRALQLLEGDGTIEESF